MIELIKFLNIDIKGIIIIVVVSLLIIALLVVIINKRKHKSRYNRFYRKLDKTIIKKYNGNMLIEDLVNKYTLDSTNTYKSLKRKGKSLTKKYLRFYYDNLPELVRLKSMISPDKLKSELMIIILDDNERLLFKWDKTKKIKGLNKAMNKYQMLMPLIAFLYELPININEGKTYRLVNHDNDNILTYDIVKAPKKYREKQVKQLNKKAKKNK